MLKVGLTGGIATGKSQVARLLVQKGAKSVNSDQFAHKLLMKNTSVYKKVLKEFGEEVLNKSNNIDRKKLANIVFNQSRKLQKLEKIIHPPVIKEIKNWMKGWKNSNRVSVVVVEVPLLFEKKLESLFDVVVAVTAPKKEQISRSFKRFGFTPKEVELRLKAQMDQNKKAKKADIVIQNNKGLKELKQKVSRVWKELCRQAAA